MEFKWIPFHTNNVGKSPRINFVFSYNGCMEFKWIPFHTNNVGKSPRINFVFSYNGCMSDDMAIKAILNIK